MTNIEQDRNNDLLAPPRSLTWRLIALVIIGSVLMIAGAIIALLRPEMLLAHGQQVTPGVHVYAGYVVSRNLALGLFLLAALTLRMRAALGSLMVLYAGIQFLDVILDCIEGRWSIVPGILVLGILFLIGAARLFPFWSLKGWRQA